MNIKRWRPELLGLIAASFITRLWSLFTPNAVVFDEVYFKQFAAHYLDGHYYFDIHPPLGKLLLAGFAKFLGLSSGALLDGTAVGLRLLPALAGALLVPLIWGILRRLGASRPFAFLGALAILLENALLVESRFILMDSMLMLFGLGAVYLYLVARDSHTKLRWLWLTLAALSAGAAVSIKWTGLNALAIIGLIWLWDQAGRKATWAKRVTEIAILAVVPLLLYISVFFVHFQLLPRSGDGDAFMTTPFQSTLQDNPSYDPSAKMSFGDKFRELNYEMYHANQTLTATHPYGSHWYTWPLEIRPIYYWQGDTLDNGRQGNIYLLGNPTIWWGIWIAVLTGLSYVWVTRHKLRPRTIAALSLAGVAYFINLLPFVGVARVMFLYHYFFSLVFSLIFAVILWNDLSTDSDGHQLRDQRSKRVYAAVVALVVLTFVFFIPITYGVPLSPAGLQAHMWLHSWR
jgi:dolichyl-phosphate-mannose-protein mannosyltransferase